MRSILTPVLLLVLLAGFSLWNSRMITQDLNLCIRQLDTAREQAAQERWEDTVLTLRSSYRDWEERQTYLHVVALHTGLDEAELLYHRAAAFAETEDAEEFLAESAALRSQLQLLVESEQLRIGNIM